jgi:hypothetical protein
MALALLASCGRGNDHLVLQPPSTGGGSTTAPPTAVTGGATTAKGGSATTAGRPGAPSTTGKSTGSTAGPGATTGSTAGTVASGAVHPESRGGPGSFARVLLRPAPATRLIVEVLVQTGASPQQATLDHVSRVLKDASGKAVQVSAPITVPGSGGAISDSDIRAMADRYGQATQSGSQAVIRLLFLKGSYGPDDNALGVTVRGDVAAVFSDAVRSAASPIVSRSVIEDAVSVHEVGHVLGLVDLVLATGRQDPDHPGHSRSRSSVMYWAVESDIVAQVLGGPPPREFDGSDKADLATIRSGA